MGKIKDTVRKVGKVLTGKSIEQGRMYDYSTTESREETIPYLYEYAKANRSEQQGKWVMYDNYYNNQHVTQLELQKVAQDKGLPFIPAIIPDPFIHVESQILPDIPDFEFSGRDDDMDSVKAKQREFVVRFVAENNKLESMNTDNERRLNKLGNAFWKVAFDYSIEGPGFNGDLIIGNPSPANIFPDPSALEIDDCEYVDYVYRMHKMKVARTFRKDLERLKLTIFDLDGEGYHGDTQIFNSQTQDVNDDTLQIVEHWFRQPVEGSDTREYEIDGKTVKRKVSWEAGDIACSIMIGSREVRYIPKYWEKTGRQNKLYPFVKYCKIPIDGSFWDMSEIAPIKDLVDAGDRELSMFILNDTFNANDIVLMEENALADDSEAVNVPGAQWKVRSGMINNVRRLGGLSNLNGGLKDSINFIRSLIQETVGNFDSTQGKEPVRVTTSSGIAQLNERADARKNIKKADRLAGFERLYELIDWSCLEFFDDERLIFIGATDEKAKKNFEQIRQTLPQGQQFTNLDPTQGPIIFKFNADKMRSLDAGPTDRTGEATWYYPRIDASVHAGDGVRKSKAFTTAAISDLSKMNITPYNYRIFQAWVDLLDLPNRKEIKEGLEQAFSQPQGQPGQINPQQIPQLTPEELMASLSTEEQDWISQHPEILDQILQGGGM